MILSHSCLHQCSRCGMRPALPQDCQEWVLRISPGMVSLGLCNNWRSIPGAFIFHVFHSYHIRYSSCPILPKRMRNWLIPTGPRFVLVGLWYLLTARSNSSLPKYVALAGLFRTLTCGGWTYVTSTDAHDWHDIFMISYIVATLPWTLGCLALSPNNRKAIKYRKYLASAFFGTLVPLIYFFIQHKVHKVAGGKFHHWQAPTTY